MRGDQVGAPVLAHQGQYSLAVAGVEVPVSDEVQHVYQQVLQVGPGRARSPVHLGTPWLARDVHGDGLGRSLMP